MNTDTESSGIALLFLNYGARWGWMVVMPCHFTHGKEILYPLVGCWVGPRTGLDGYGKSRHHRDSYLGPSANPAPKL